MLKLIYLFDMKRNKKTSETQHIVFYYDNLQPGFHWVYLKPEWITAIKLDTIQYIDNQMVLTRFALSHFFPLIRMACRLYYFKQTSSKLDLYDLTLRTETHETELKSFYKVQFDDFALHYITKVLKNSNHKMVAELIQLYQSSELLNIKKSYVPATEEDLFKLCSSSFEQ